MINSCCRTNKFINIKALAITGLALVLFSLGCATPQAMREQYVTAAPDFYRLEQGAYSLLLTNGMKFRLYADEDSFAKDYGQIHSGTFPKPKAPSINFDKWVVAGAFLGRMPTAGYSIDLVRDESVAETEDAWLVLNVVIKEPPEGSVTAQVLTSPYVLVKLPRGVWEGVHFRGADGRELSGLIMPGD